jgi:hypothetical protein
MMTSAAEPLTEQEVELKERLTEEGFDWSRRDFQQFVKALEAYGWFVFIFYSICKRNKSFVSTGLRIMSCSHPRSKTKRLMMLRSIMLSLRRNGRRSLVRSCYFCY